jgi:hypothetical protein
MFFEDAIFSARARECITSTMQLQLLEDFARFLPFVLYGEFDALRRM